MTDFRQDRAIYMQIAERICDDILAGVYAADERIPSVREMSVTLEVNANTIVRTYDFLTGMEVIYTKRGMGFFVSSNARDIILKDRRTGFMEQELPDMFRRMKLLGITFDEIAGVWKKWDG